jgi:hypothetical protein
MTTQGQMGQAVNVFGTGAPVQLMPKGTKYFDDTATPYGEYISTGAAWVTQRLAPCTVALLPVAGATNKGAIGSVTDASAALTAGIGTTVVGGGANIVPVFSDGTAWKIG